MGMTDINYIMDMTKSFLAGEIDSMNYYLDFPFEVEKRYQKMIREDGEYADLIFECLVEEEIGKFIDLSHAQFKRLIKKQYKYMVDSMILYLWGTSLTNNYDLPRIGEPKSIGSHYMVTILRKK